MNRGLAITTLGELAFRHNGEVVTDFPSRKIEALLVYLAIEVGYSHRRESLFTLLWPGMPEGSARHNLRQLLYALHQRFPNVAAYEEGESVPLLLVDRQKVEVNPRAVVDVDVHRLDRILEGTRTHKHLNLVDCEACLQALEEAVKLYIGEFLSGFYLEDSNAFEDWAMANRTACRHKVLDTLEILTDIYIQRGAYHQASTHAERQLAIDPLREVACRQLMEALSRAGQRSEALRQYQDCARLLEEEMRAVPERETTELYERIRKGDLQPAGEKKPVSTARADLRHNLPAQMTSFIGREKEIAKIQDFLKSHRLVTLTGSGGTGKTRLSLEVAAEILDLFPDGVWLAELAPLADPNLVAETVARSLGMQLASGAQALSFLEDYLKDKNTLLVLDNCEHLIQACAHLAHALLHACPSLVILATSREALGIEGEFAYQVPPLSFPEAEELPSFDELEQFAAIRLFLVRARSVLPDFQITHQNERALVQICRHLDGIPLAIELAAARLKFLNVEEIARRLNDRFRLLIGGSRADLPRYQTLRASLDWSYDLLSPPERTLLQRLSTFAGGWSLQAAEYVSCGEGIESSDVLDLLGWLVNKSLVFVKAGAGAETRYNMLETIRQYANEKLVESSQAKRVRDRHLQYYLDLAEKTGSRLRGPEQPQRLVLLEAELDNMRLALDWSLKSAGQPDGDLEAGMRIASALRWFWHARGRHEEGLQWLERLLSVDAEKYKLASPNSERNLSPSHAKIRAWALLVAGSEAWESHTEETNKTVQYLEESRELFLKLGPEGRLGYAEVLCTSSEMIIDYENTEKLAEESLQIFKEEGDQFGMAQCYSNLGENALIKNKYEKAREYIENQLLCFKSIGDRDGMGYAYDLLGNIEFLTGDLEKARILLEQSCEIFSEIHNDFFQDPWLGLAHIDWVEGDYTHAAQIFQQVYSIGKRIGSSELISNGLQCLGFMALSQGDNKGAAKFFEQNLNYHLKKENKTIIADSLRNLGDLAWAEGDLNRAITNYLEAQKLFLEVGRQYQAGTILVRLGRCAYELGENQKARSYLQDCLDKLIPGYQLDCLSFFETIAYLETASNKYESAAQLLGYTQDVYNRNQRRLSPKSREMREQAIASLKQAMSEDAFSRAWEEGEKITLERAMEYALGESI